MAQKSIAERNESITVIELKEGSFFSFFRYDDTSSIRHVRMQRHLLVKIRDRLAVNSRIEHVLMTD